MLEQIAPVTIPSMPADDSLCAARALFDALHQREIRYCHWKSNIRLAESLAGRTDLDLLVDASQQDAFLTAIAGLGYQPLLDPPGKQYPGLSHYLGIDWDTGSLLHLHVHFRLVLGEQFLKNYHLPLETALLENTCWLNGVRVPSPALELIILTLRVLLKYRDRDVLKDTLSIRSPGIIAPMRDELRWLLRQASPAEVEAALAALPEWLPRQAILAFLTSFDDRRDGLRMLRLRQQVRRALARHQRSGRVAVSTRYLSALWRESSRGDRQMTLPGGGRMIALVGVDGSGKTSLSTALRRWLSWKVDTHLMYLGSKQPSLRSTALYWLFRMARRSQTEIRARFGDKNLAARALGGVRQVMLACHYLSVGADRLRRYRRAEKLVQGGSVVIFDRFPFEAPLDGPEVARVAREGPLALAPLVRLEERLYQHFTLPDHLIVLNVPLRESRRRKPDHPAAVIEAKQAALSRVKGSLQAQGAAWTEIDAGEPLDDVLLAVKRAVWGVLWS